MDTLKRLRELAAKAQAADDPNIVYCDAPYHAMHDALSPDVVLRLIACIEAADAMRDTIVPQYLDFPERGFAYDAARAALNEEPR